MSTISSLSRTEEEAIIQDWAKRNGYIDGETLRLRLGLSRAEWDAATFFDRVIPQVELPQELQTQLHWYQSGYYRNDFELTEGDRARISAETILTKQDACLRLSISPRTFERWKKITNTRHAVLTHVGSDPIVYGYRQSDIDQMARTIRNRRGRP